MYQLSGGSPFRRDASGAVFDAAGERIKLLGDTAAVFSQLATDPDWAGVQIAYVSRTEYPEWAVPCLKEFLVQGHPQVRSQKHVLPCAVGLTRKPRMQRNESPPFHTRRAARCSQ